MRYPCAHKQAFIGLSLAMLWLLPGCGVSFPGLTAGDSGLPSARFAPGAEGGGALAVVVLNWDAGHNALYPAYPMAAVDLSMFETDGGHTLAEHSAFFKEQVRTRVEEILESVGLFAEVVVANDDRDWKSIETTVHLTQEISPDGSMEIGRAHYDPCNEHEDDEAVIFGERIRRLGDRYTFDEWVNVFSNVCAHETAHTLGFGHVSRAEHPPTARALYVELMLDGFTMSEMTRSHRMLTDLSNCPDEDEVLEGDTIPATTP
jgi:hypothetical protein